ncbi:MAG: GNAT family N-acetyltransferase [Lentimicrobiaceae bacterium]|nr:GNAT family N-acetyltransferase [Lentimicrobiaceae bacterium]
MEEIKSLDKISFDTLFEAFNEAFGSYEVQVNKEELSIILKRRGFVSELSFGAFDSNKLVAFTLNGIGSFNGLKTAYDTGTGTIKAYRGKGLASKVFTVSIPFLKEANITQYLLEVLQHNPNAISVYKNLDFTVSREFNYYVQANTEVKLLSKDLPAAFYMKETSLDNKEQFMRFWDFKPSWQNSFEAVQRSIADFKIIGVYQESKLVGYGIFEPGSGDITQIAVDKSCRRQGIATVLLKEMIQYNRHSSVKAVNAETTCESIDAFLESNGIPLKGKQFEMIKKL